MQKVKKKCKRYAIAKKLQVTWAPAVANMAFVMWLKGKCEKEIAAAVKAVWGVPGHTNGSSVRSKIYKIVRGHTKRDFLNDPEFIPFTKLLIDRTGVRITTREVSLINAAKRAGRTLEDMSLLFGRSLEDMHLHAEGGTHERKLIICE